MSIKQLTFIWLSLLVGALFLKIYLIVADNKGVDFYDDQRNYQIAQNFEEGRGYTLYTPSTNSYRLTAFHTSSTVFLYRFLISHHISRKTTVIVFFCLSTILYILTLVFLYKLLALLRINKMVIYTAVFVYAIYPSVMYAMGTKFHFDNIVMPLLVINFYFLTQWLRRSTITVSARIFLLLSITVSCFLRTQVLLIYFLIGCFFIFRVIKGLQQKRHIDYSLTGFILLTGACVSLAYIPILKKNKAMFGSYIISTQAGFEFSQGHNGITRGNWGGDSFYKFAVPGPDSLDEYQDSRAQQQKAWRWIKDNPQTEIKYAFKKAARYFLPENMPMLSMHPYFRYHPLTVLVHLAFIMIMGVGLLRYRAFLFSKEMLLFLVPVFATIGVSIAFYFDFKLRYYGDPFMIIIAAYAVNQVLLSKSNTTSIQKKGRQAV